MQKITEAQQDIFWDNKRGGIHNLNTKHGNRRSQYIPTPCSWSVEQEHSSSSYGYDQRELDGNSNMRKHFSGNHCFWNGNDTHPKQAAGDQWWRFDFCSWKYGNGSREWRHEHLPFQIAGSLWRSTNKKEAQIVQQWRPSRARCEQWTHSVSHGCSAATRTSSNATANRWNNILMIEKVVHQFTTYMYAFSPWQFMSKPFFTNIHQIKA